MKIALVGSMRFVERIIDIYRKLERMGHAPEVHEQAFGLVDGTAAQLRDTGIEHADIKRKYGFIRWWHECIKRNDAILVCNFDKDGIRNYIGGNTLMEMGFAHVNNKKIFLLNPVPEDVPYVEEIKAMVDEVINGDLGRISLDGNKEPRLL
jgi:hypothetical protein